MVNFFESILYLIKKLFKKRNRSLTENTLWGIYGEFFSRAIKFMQLILIANYLSVEGMGLFNYSIATAGMLSVFYDFGILVVATKNNTQAATHGNLAPYFLLKCLTSTIGFLIFIILLSVGFVQNENTSVIVILVASVIVSDIANLILASYRSKKDFQKEAKFRSLVIIAQFLASGLVLLFNGDLRAVSYSLLIVNIICLYPLVRLLVINHKNFLTNASSKLKLIFVECIPFAGMVMVGALYTNIDVLLLGYFFGMSEVGIYAVAMKFVLGLIIVPITFIQNAQIPDLVAHNDYDEKNISALYYDWLIGYQKTVLFGYLLCLVFAIFSEYIIFWTFGFEFKESVNMLVSLTIVGISYYLYTPLITLFIITKKVKYSFYGQLICCVVNLILLLWLIPIYGIYGAVVSSIVTHLIIFLILFFTSKAVFPNLFSARATSKIFSRLFVFILLIFVMKYANIQNLIDATFFKIIISSVFLIYTKNDILCLCSDLSGTLKRLIKN